LEISAHYSVFSAVAKEFNKESGLLVLVKQPCFLQRNFKLSDFEATRLDLNLKAAD
jgi:hypothetical protein